MLSFLACLGLCPLVIEMLIKNKNLFVAGVNFHKVVQADLPRLYFPCTEKRISHRSAHIFTWRMKHLKENYK